MSNDEVTADVLVTSLWESFQVSEAERLEFLSALSDAIGAKPDLATPALVDKLLDRTITEFGQAGTPTATALRSLVAKLAVGRPEVRVNITDRILRSIATVDKYRRSNTDGIRLVADLAKEGQGCAADVVSDAVVDAITQVALNSKSKRTVELCHEALTQLSISDGRFAERIALAAEPELDRGVYRQRRAEAILAIVSKARPEICAAALPVRPLGLKDVTSRLRKLGVGE